MSFPSKKTLPLLLLGALGAVALVVMASQLDLMTKWDLHTSVDDVVHGRNLQEATKKLQDTPRGPTIEALKEALDKEDGTPSGKVAVLQLLGQFKEERVVARAIDSDVLTTRRAAAYARQGDKEVSQRASDIALEWIADKGAGDRYLAGLILRSSNRADAAPILIGILRDEGENPDSARVIVQVLGALAQFKPEGIAETVMELARNPATTDRVRSEAFALLTRLDDAPRDKLRALLLDVARDDQAAMHVRHSAVSLLGLPANASEETWDVLKTILFDENEKDQVFQRTALLALGRSYPIDRLPEVLLDRRVYTHRYFGIRSDVASGLGNLAPWVRYQEKLRRLALTVLCDLMADKDQQDITDNVPRQAWIAYWQITKTVIIPDEFKDGRRLFLRAPPAWDQEDLLREYLFSFSWGNPQISREQVNALDFCTMSMEDARIRTKEPAEFERRREEKEQYAERVSQLMRDQIGKLLAAWNENPPAKPELKQGPGAKNDSKDEKKPEEQKPEEKQDDEGR